MSDFIERTVELATRTVDRLVSSSVDAQEIMVEMSSMLARTEALQVLSVWLDVVGQRVKESENVRAFHAELTHMRFVEMEDKKICSIENVFGEQNKLLSSGYDLAKALAVWTKEKVIHPNIRIEHWVDGEYKYTYVLSEEGKIVGTTI